MKVREILGLPTHVSTVCRLCYDYHTHTHTTRADDSGGC